MNLKNNTTNSILIQKERSSIGTGCLEMEGMSTVEIDVGGIYLSLPVSTETVSTGGTSVPLGLEDVERTETGSTSSRIFKKGVSSLISLSSYTSTTKKDKKLDVDSRMILHIPTSDSITVVCTQPTSLIISIPLSHSLIPSEKSMKEKNNSISQSDSNLSFSDKESESSNISPNKISGNESISSDLSHGQQTAQQIGPAIAPWSYIQSHSERAVDVTEDDEIEASDFALTLASIERFIAALPSTATDVKIAINCMDRLQRDSLALAIRALAGQASQASLEVRRQAYSWDEEDSDSVHGSSIPVESSISADKNDYDHDLKSSVSSSLPLNISIATATSPDNPIKDDSPVSSSMSVSVSVSTSLLSNVHDVHNTTENAPHTSSTPATVSPRSQCDSPKHHHKGEDKIIANLKAQHSIREVSINKLNFSMKIL